MGSAGDGFGFFLSQGSNRHLLEKKSVLTQDIDLNIFIETMKVKPENIINVPGSTGFTWIKLTVEEV